MKIPPELQITKLPFPSAEELALEISKSGGDPSPLGRSNEGVPITAPDSCKTLVQMAGQLWRMATVVIDAETGEPRSEFSSQEIRKLAGALEAMQESIESFGIRVIDRCNQDFHPGLPDKVASEEPREGISRERIIRTIRPTIMWHQTMVQRGEIDIAVPLPNK